MFLEGSGVAKVRRGDVLLVEHAAHMGIAWMKYNMGFLREVVLPSFGNFGFTLTTVMRVDQACQGRGREISAHVALVDNFFFFTFKSSGHLGASSSFTSSCS